MNLLPPYTPKVWKAIGLCVAGIVLIGAVLFISDRVSSWWSVRRVDKLKANVNATITGIKEREQTIANLNERQAVDKERVRIETEELAEAANASAEAQAETNKALANLQQARNANTVNTSVEDLEKLLEKLK
jgi:hypothetical protein